MICRFDRGPWNSTCFALLGEVQNLADLSQGEHGEINTKYFESIKKGAKKKELNVISSYNNLPVIR